MAKNFKLISVLTIIAVNLILLTFFLFTSCDYLKLLSRKEWIDKNGASSKNIYLYALMNSSVTSYKIDPVTGSLTLLNSTPINFGTAVSPSASYFYVDKNNNFMYIIFESAGLYKSVSAFSISNNGSLTPLSAPSFPFGLQNTSSVIYLDRMSEYLYYMNTSGITSYKVDNTTGTIMGGVQNSVASLTFGNICVPYSLIGDPSSTYLYCHYLMSSPLYYNYYVLKVNKPDGKLTNIGGIYNSGFNITSQDIDPSGNFLYAYGSSVPYVKAYDISNKSLNPIAGSPYTPAGTPNSSGVLKISPDGKTMILTCGNTNINSYTINSSNGVLSNSYYLGFSNGPKKITYDTSSQYAYIIDNISGQSSIDIIKINGDGTFAKTNYTPFLVGSSINDLVIVGK
jgi:6-phosphogluconolactonase (cycloisomerase 2 family)